MSASLLKVSPVESSAERLLEGLDADQRRVATTFGVPVAVIAGAGTGKTRALTHRIAYGVASGVYSANSVLALTFTTSAAGELRSRLHSLGLATIQARTFHSAALRQAQYFWPRAYGSELPPVSDERAALLAAAARKLRLAPESGQLRDLLTEVSWAKVTNVAPADYASLAQSLGREVAGFSAAQVGQVLGSYERVKTERGLIDFDDILLCTVALLSEHADIAEEVRATYQHLLVDEYQDVSPLQQTLLDLWWGSGTEHCVVGDPAQTIHSFAGASPEFLLGFAARRHGAEVIRLVRDYRSTPEVVAVANRASTRLGIGAVHLEAVAAPGPTPQIVAFENDAAEAAGLARWLIDRHEAGIRWRDLAVLYRIHAQSPLFEAALAEAQIPFAVRGAEGFYQRSEVRQVIAALHSRAAEAPAHEAVPGCRQVLVELGWSPNAPAGQGRVRERWESWSAVLALAEDLADTQPAAQLSALVAELDRRAAAEHPLSPDGVTLSTLHAAKGLEWSGVALVGLAEGTLPLSLASTPAELAEEARLFYVGITRAATDLMMSWSRSRHSGPGSRQPSRFLDGLSGPSSVAPIARGNRVQRASALSQTCRACGRSLNTGAERKLGRHQDCPANVDERLHSTLLAWRGREAHQRGLPSYCIFTDATVLAIAERHPRDAAALMAVPGVGRAKFDQFGAAVLEVLNAALD